MIITATDLPGACFVDIEALEDERGFFARSWCRDTFARHGLETELVQCNLSGNRRKGTLRGMHYQQDPHAEVKLVRCVRGSIYDVIVDIRPDSPTYCRWLGVELNESNRRGLYIPRGMAHGFLTLSDDTEVFYQMSSHYVPESAAGIRWDDPAIGIDWPDVPRCMSERDRQFADFSK